MAEINYDAIKTEYLTTDASFASLAKKYGINHSSVSRKAKKDHWDEEKAQMRTQAHKVVQEKTIEAQVSIADKCMRIMEKLVDKVAESVDVVDPDNTQSMKQIVSMMKDLSDMGAFDMLTSSGRNNITIEFVGMNDEYGD